MQAKVHPRIDSCTHILLQISLQLTLKSGSSNIVQQPTVVVLVATENIASSCRTVSSFSVQNNSCQCWVGFTNTQISMLPDSFWERNVRSKFWWFTRFCNSYYVSHFAALFIVVGAETSIAESCMSFFSRFLRLKRIKYSVLPQGQYLSGYDSWRIKTKLLPRRASPFIPGLVGQELHPSWAQLSILGLKQSFSLTRLPLLSSEWVKGSTPPGWILLSITIAFKTVILGNTFSQNPKVQKSRLHGLSCPGLIKDRVKKGLSLHQDGVRNSFTKEGGRS